MQHTVKAQVKVKECIYACNTRISWICYFYFRFQPSRSTSLKNCGRWGFISFSVFLPLSFFWFYHPFTHQAGVDIECFLVLIVNKSYFHISRTTQKPNWKIWTSLELMMNHNRFFWGLQFCFFFSVFVLMLTRCSNNIPKSNMAHSSQTI